MAPNGENLGQENFMYSINDVIDGSDALELLLTELAISEFLELNRKVDKVDTVEIQIIHKACLPRNFVRRNLKHLFKMSLKLLVDIIARQHDFYFACCDRINLARLR